MGSGEYDGASVDDASVDGTSVVDGASEVDGVSEDGSSVADAVWLLETDCRKVLNVK